MRARSSWRPFEDGREARLIEELSKKAVLNIFKTYFNVAELESVVQHFGEGEKVETGSEKPSREYRGFLENIGGLSQSVQRLGADGRPELVASATEFILEGLHLNRRLNRDQVEKGFRYRS